MKIEFMRIENWRSFYGKNEIFFSTDAEKNVTLVRAENGVGKTSLLAALNWCLFGILPNEDDFQNPKSLVNSYARLNENARQTKVELEFLSITLKIVFAFSTIFFPLSYLTRSFVHSPLSLSNSP